MLPLATGDSARTLASARRASELGYDGVFSFDHLHAPQDASRPSLEAFTMLAAIATACPALAVGTMVARVGVRPLGVLAKMAAQLDDLSGGKAILGLGAGDEGSHDELTRFGIPDPATQGERRQLLGETTAAVRALLRGQVWAGGAVTGPVTGPLLPTPMRRDGPPIWLGGVSDEVVALAATVADGWNGWALGLASFQAKVATLKATAAEAGRTCEATWGGICVLAPDQGELERLLKDRRERDRPSKGVWTGTGEAFTSFASGLEQAGATWLIVASGGAGTVEQAAKAMAG